jgi:hypothetical protein
MAIYRMTILFALIAMSRRLMTGSRRKDYLIFIARRKGMILTETEWRCIWNDKEKLRQEIRLLDYLKDLADKSMNYWKGEKEKEDNPAIINQIDRYIQIGRNDYDLAEMHILVLTKRLMVLEEEL